jgi:N-acetylglucosaminyl-diphospho-decaprenol L-rhamnosyltransferase
MPNLTIIIVTFNSSQIIEKCLSHLNLSKYEVIIVDNCSQDNTAQIIETKFPQIKFLKNPKNSGYGRANNIALRQAKTDFALILNPDAFILEEDIEKILTVIKNNENVAIAGPLLLSQYPVSPEELDQKLTRVKTASTEQLFKGYLKAGIVGAVLFMKMDILRKIGFFDENIFLYHEDGEICSRAINQNYQSIIIHDALAFHQEGTSSTPSLRNLYRRHWHLSWSKSYCISKNNRLYPVIRSGFIRLFNSFMCLVSFNTKKFVSNFAAFLGCASFLIGLKAFRKDGTPRG